MVIQCEICNCSSFVLWIDKENKKLCASCKDCDQEINIEE